MDSIAIGSAGLCEAGTDLAGGLARLGSVEIGSAGQDLAELGWDDLARISWAGPGFARLGSPGMSSGGVCWSRLSWTGISIARFN